VHEYNPDFYILRQSGCRHDEKPFLYLLFGSDKALLLDTGAGPAEPRTATVDLIIHLHHPAMMTRYGWGVVRAQA